VEEAQAEGNKAKAVWGCLPKVALAADNKDRAARECLPWAALAAKGVKVPKVTTLLLYPCPLPTQGNKVSRDRWGKWAPKESRGNKVSRDNRDLKGNKDNQ
jgi:hypothetical protein